MRLVAYTSEAANPTRLVHASAARQVGDRVSLPDGETWRTAMIHLPRLPFRDVSLLRKLARLRRRTRNSPARPPAKDAGRFIARHTGGN